MPKVLSHYGHYHQTVITPEKYADAHPEYFVYGGGRRNSRSAHLCFSNPEVRELIYNKILEDCDKGYDIIEVGQNDGFVPCQCEKCYNLYGIKPTHNPREGRSYLMDSAWGEKLWIMHRDMALRLQKDRPGKKIMVSAYSVTKNPPKDNKKFSGQYDGRIDGTSCPFEGLAVRLKYLPDMPDICTYGALATVMFQSALRRI